MQLEPGGFGVKRVEEPDSPFVAAKGGTVACRRFWLALAAHLILSPVWLLADWGSIAYDFDAKVHEPTQNAIIAWNGTEEILIIATELSSSEPTKVLEVMPLPSKPTVEEGSLHAFRHSVRLINEKTTAIEGRKEGYWGSAAPITDPTSAAKVAEKITIGAHDISVVQVLNPKAFVAWVEAFAARSGVPQLRVPPELLTVIGEYCNEGYVWFVFDVVSLTKDVRPKIPIKLRFKSDHLYYPLRITRTEVGQTEVSLIVFTTTFLHKDAAVGLPTSKMEMDSYRLHIWSDELQDVDKDIWELLGKPRKGRMRIWKVVGEASGFQQDILFKGIWE